LPQFNLSEDKGALVGDVTEESPAEKAGLKRGDVIMKYNGKEVDEPTSLRNMVANTPPNTDVKLGVLRDGKPLTIQAKIAELPAGEQKTSGEFNNRLRGVQVRDITPEARKSLNIPKRIAGVLIAGIEEGSPAEGILANSDIILEINKEKIQNVKDYESAVKNIKPEQSMLMLIYRKGVTTYVTLSPQQ
jgi:serine protease Do